MAEYHTNHHEEAMKTQESTPVETGDRGLFDFTKKKDEEKISSEFEEKAVVSESTDQDHHHKELHRSNSSSSSSSDEEGCDEEEKKKKKEKKSIKEKLPSNHEQDTEIPVEQIYVGEEVYTESAHDNKGIFDKIKDKMSGHHQASDDVETPPTTPALVVEGGCTGQPPVHEEKKGFLEKIKDKIPGFHSKTSTCEVEKEKEKAKE